MWEEQARALPHHLLPQRETLSRARSRMQPLLPWRTWSSVPPYHYCQPYPSIIYFSSFSLFAPWSLPAPSLVRRGRIEVFISGRWGQEGKELGDWKCVRIHIHIRTGASWARLYISEKIFTLLLPKYIWCLGSAHTHTQTQSKVHYHTTLFCNGFPCFASVRGKRWWWRGEKPSVVVINHLLVLSHLSPSRFSVPCYPTMPPSTRHTISPTAQEPPRKSLSLQSLSASLLTSVCLLYRTLQPRFYYRSCHLFSSL